MEIKRLIVGMVQTNCYIAVHPETKEAVIVDPGDEAAFEAAGYTFQMLHTPGHTEGSCCYYVKSEKVLFSGDTLFEGSYGRIDFPTGSGRQMIHSVADILLNLPDDTNVYPGHMGYTTIADEKQYNPLAGYRGREA